MSCFPGDEVAAALAGFFDAMRGLTDSALVLEGARFAFGLAAGLALAAGLSFPAAFGFAGAFFLAAVVFVFSADDEDAVALRFAADILYEHRLCGFPFQLY